MANAAEPVPGASIDARYSGFNIVTVDYKQVNGIGIPVSILIPNNLSPGEHPVAVRWHGGGFGTGHRLFAEWYAKWTLAIYHTHSAIALSPDYRLLPESTGLDILSDAKDFYAWLFTPGNLSTYLPPNITPSPSLLVTGESAGGWHALQAGLLHPERVAAIIAHYPMLDLRAPHFSQPEPRDISSPDLQALTTYTSTLHDTQTIPVPSRTPPAGESHILTIMQHGLYHTYFGTDERLYPLEMLEKAEKFPPTWILHGAADVIVPVDGTRKFVGKMAERMPETPVLVTVREGAGHGFDLRDDDDDGWREEGLRFIERFWPPPTT